jgi:hypothetical protein
MASNWDHRNKEDIKEGDINRRNRSRHIRHTSHSISNNPPITAMDMFVAAHLTLI